MHRIDPKEPTESLIELRQLQSSSRAPSNHDEVDCRIDFSTTFPKPGADTPLEAIAPHRIADLPARRNPETALGDPQHALSLSILLRTSRRQIGDSGFAATREGHDDEITMGATATTTQYAAKIPRIDDPVRSSKSTGRNASLAHVYLDATVAARRFRPLARRRFNTARPAFVFIRSRKPCLRRRLIRLGW